MQQMIIEITHDLTPYLSLLSLFFTVAAMFAFGYLLNQSFKKHPSLKTVLEKEQDSQLSSQLMQNETNAIFLWMTKQMRRYDSGDDVPSAILLGSLAQNEKHQGGFIWKRKLHSFHGKHYLHSQELHC
ncbi:hypothetical protein [Peribacillus frigoritolerans]|uniref:hypothetical protein n=1 Tax=Peribacillus frigoritolerans TaxID=450367 RepID=UPI00105999A2|nr:hypothetical protein [Peribacillus frigoritolerans]TDL83032.1 hypothetical protein E2R53_05745 [Peribacillus frigoritolerans]